MKTEQFKKWLVGLDNLTTRQSRVLQEELGKRAQRKEVSNFLETPYQDIKCPHCHASNISRWGKRSDLQRYKCHNCHKTFNSLTGTPLARLRRKGHWMDYAQCIKDGLTIRRAAEVCDIHPNTAFRWRHRFLTNTKEIKAPLLEGIVEANDIYFRKSEKGSRKLARPARQRGDDKQRAQYSVEKICVLVSRDRHKNTLDALIDELNTNALEQLLHKHLAQDILFCSDNRPQYRNFAKTHNIRHGYIQLSKGEVVKKDIVHIQHVSAYQARLQSWIHYHFRGVATKYLENYLGWLRELDEFDDQITPGTILLRAQKGGKYRYLPSTVT
ncbi:MAG: IS1595 family transposase [Bacteroidales bacterium]